jgi:hypothetical protein
MPVVAVNLDDNTVKVGDVIIASDIVLVLRNGEAYVGFRAIAEAFGAEVNWDRATRSVIVTLPSGVTFTFVPADAGAINVDGHIYVPLAYIASVF